VLFLIEWEGIDPLQYALARNQDGHSLSDDVTNDRKENDGDRDGLWLEEVNCSKYGAKGGKSKTFTALVLSNL